MWPGDVRHGSFSDRPRPDGGPDEDVPPREVLGSSFLTRAAIIAVCWLPFVAVFSLFFPLFVPIFSKLEARGELPTLTAWFLSLRQLAGQFPGSLLMFVLLLIAADAGLDSAVRSRGWSRGVSWSCFVTIGACGLFALLLLMLAMRLEWAAVSVGS